MQLEQKVIAKYEQANVLERSRHSAQVGTVNVLNYVPYGYRYIIEQKNREEAHFDIDLVEARVVRKIFEWVGQDQCSIGEVQRRLTQAKEQTRTGKTVWHRATIWGILKNPAYRGEAVFGRNHVEPRHPRLQDQHGGGIMQRRAFSIQDISAGQWVIIPIPALIDTALFDAVAEQLQEYQQRIQSQERGAHYLLQGLIVCKSCGNTCYGKFVRQRGSKGNMHSYAYYCCIGTDIYCLNGVQVCDNKQLRMDRVDKIVWNEVCQLLKCPERFEQEYHHLTKEKVVREVYKIKDQLDKLKQGRTRLIDSYAEGLIDKTEFEPRMTRIREQINYLEENRQKIKREAYLEKELCQLLEGLDDFSSYLREGLDAADWSTRQEIIQAVVKRVEINQEQVRVVFRVGSSTVSPSSEKNFPEFVVG